MPTIASPKKESTEVLSLCLVPPPTHGPALLRRPTALQLVLGESFPSARDAAAEGGKGLSAHEVANPSDMGVLVQQMVAMLPAVQAPSPPPRPGAEEESCPMDVEDAADADVEDDGGEEDED